MALSVGLEMISVCVSSENAQPHTRLNCLNHLSLELYGRLDRTNHSYIAVLRFDRL